MITSGYKSNTDLRQLADHLGFNLYIFDDGPVNLKLQDTTGGGEIDAVLFYKNIILIIEVYSGSNNRQANSKITKFRRDFRNFDKSSDFNNLNITNTGLTSTQNSRAEAQLNDIKTNIDTYKSLYSIKIVKLFFCSNIDISEEQETKYQKQGVTILDKEVFTYFNEIHRTLEKDYLVRDFLSFFNIKKNDLERRSSSRSSRSYGTTVGYKVTKLELKSQSMIMYSTAIPVEDIVEFVTVFRIGQKRYNVKGFQRMLKNKRLEKIAKDYLSKNETFPNNIIIALDPELYKTESHFYNSSSEEFKFITEYNSLFIIDGQHRFFSFLKNNSNEKEVLINLIFFKGGVKAIKTIYQMFYQINQSQVPIEPSLGFVLKAMIDQNSDDAFWFEVFTNLNKQGFFQNKVSFKERQLRYEGEKGIISVLKYGGILTLNKDRKINGIFSSGLNKINDSLSKKNKIKFNTILLKNYFVIIEMVLRAQSKTKDDLTPREIGSLIRLIRHFLIRDHNKLNVIGNINNINSLNPAQGRSVNYVKCIISCLDFDSILNSDLSASNWAGVEGLMIKQIRNAGKSFGNEIMLSTKGLEIFNN